jgi:hypothetical protein
VAEGRSASLVVCLCPASVESIWQVQRCCFVNTIARATTAGTEHWTLTGGRSRGDYLSQVPMIGGYAEGAVGGPEEAVDSDSVGTGTGERCL